MKTRKIVINENYGGFSLSKKAYEYLGVEWDGFGYLTDYSTAYPDMAKPQWTRDNLKLVDCVETLGEDANGESATLKIVSIPSDVDWCIEEHDGSEIIAEVHRKWY